MCAGVPCHEKRSAIKGVFPSESKGTIPPAWSSVQLRPRFKHKRCQLLTNGLRRQLRAKGHLPSTCQELRADDPEGGVVPAPLAQLLKNKVLQPFGCRPATLPHAGVESRAGAGQAAPACPGRSPRSRYPPRIRRSPPRRHSPGRLRPHRPAAHPRPARPRCRAA